MSELITVNVSSGESVPLNSALTELAFGKYGPNDSLDTTDTLTFGSDAKTTGSYNIVFSNGAGVFQGVANGAWAPAPDGNNASDPDGVQTDFLAAVGGSTLTMNFGGPQIYFGLLWGSVSDGNTLTFYNGTTSVYTLTADELETLYSANAQGNYYVSINIPGGYTSVIASSTSGGFEFANVTYADSIVTDPFAGSGVQTTPPYDPSTETSLCFLEGTMIAVPGGEVAVENLQPGTLVLTADGTAEPVRWLGTRAVSTRFADPMHAYPVRIAAGALDDGVPSRDLLLSPDHALLLDGILIQAAALVNGGDVQRETTMPDNFTYYHVELANHALILAEGQPAETFVDNVSRGHFDNWATHPDNGAVVEMDLPRAKSARQMPAATRARLAGRHRKIA